MRVLIGTPAYGSMVHLDYMNSLLEFQKQGLNFQLACFGNESLITRARNTILSYFYHQREQFTHLLFLDADIHLPARDLKQLLEFDKAVVGAAVPLKHYLADGSVRLNSSEFGQEIQANLYKTTHIGTAVMLLSRQAVVDVVEKAKAEGRVYHNDSEFDPSRATTDLEMYDVFQVGVVDDNYLSEDYWLCKELRELGYDIHVTDKASITHHGTHGFRLKPASG